MLPMPIRTLNHTVATRKIDMRDESIRNWSEDDALAVIASGLWGGGVDPETVALRRFRSRGEWRVGFSVLAMSSQLITPAFNPADGCAGVRTGELPVG